MTKIIVNPILRREQGYIKTVRIRSSKNYKLQQEIKEYSKLGLRPDSPAKLGQVSMLIGFGYSIEKASRLTKKQATLAINKLSKIISIKRTE